MLAALFMNSVSVASGTPAFLHDAVFLATQPQVFGPPNGPLRPEAEVGSGRQVTVYTPGETLPAQPGRLGARRRDLGVHAKRRLVGSDDAPTDEDFDRDGAPARLRAAVGFEPAPTPSMRHLPVRRGLQGDAPELPDVADCNPACATCNVPYDDGSGGLDFYVCHEEILNQAACESTRHLYQAPGYSAVWCNSQAVLPVDPTHPSSSCVTPTSTPSEKPYDCADAGRPQKPDFATIGCAFDLGVDHLDSPSFCQVDDCCGPASPELPPNLSVTGYCARTSNIRFQTTYKKIGPGHYIDMESSRFHLYLTDEDHPVPGCTDVLDGAWVLNLNFDCNGGIAGYVRPAADGSFTHNNHNGELRVDIPVGENSWHLWCDGQWKVTQLQISESVVVSCTNPTGAWTDAPVDCGAAGRRELVTYSPTTACAAAAVCTVDDCCEPLFCQNNPRSAPDELGCDDEDSSYNADSCTAWAANGECDMSSRGFMLTNCCASCQSLLDTYKGLTCDAIETHGLCTEADATADCCGCGGGSEMAANTCTTPTATWGEPVVSCAEFGRAPLASFATIACATSTCGVDDCCVAAHCHDEPMGWRAADGSTCNQVEAAGRCESGAANAISNDGINAASACCGCGGGSDAAQASCATPHGKWDRATMNCAKAGRARLAAFESITCTEVPCTLDECCVKAHCRDAPVLWASNRGGLSCDQVAAAAHCHSNTGGQLEEYADINATAALDEGRTATTTTDSPSHE
jgi:hypothetical protein